MTNYYLKSRYYDPQICRFINADSYASTGQGFSGCNMFVYCNDSPVAFEDSGGRRMVSCVDDWNGGGGSSETPSYEPINGQDLEPYRNIRYGISRVGFSGCEAIAVYNSLILSGKPHSFEEVMSIMVQSIKKGGGYGLCGLGGGTRSDIEYTLRCLNVNYTTASYSDLSNNGEPMIMIVGFKATNKVLHGRVSYTSIHTVAIEYTGNQFVGYNMFNQYPLEYSSPTISGLIGTEGRFLYGFILTP